MESEHLEAGSIFSDIEAMTIDRTTSSISLVMTNGFTIRAPLDPSPFGETSTIVRSEYLPSANRLVMTTNRNDTIETELPTLSEPNKISERPVIYLDQRDWSLLAQARFDPNKVETQVKLEAALHVAQLAQEQKIILPMSFAHLGETSRWGNTEGRYRLALTLTQLSRGWQMRYPIDVWRQELYHVFKSRASGTVLDPIDVFTLQPCAIESEANNPVSGHAWRRFPAGVRVAGRATVCMMSYIDSLLSEQSTPMAPIPQWTTAFQLITDELAKEKKSSAQKRNILLVLMMRDLKDQFAQAALQAALTAADVEKWSKSSFESDITATNALGVWNSVYQDKHLNPGTRWSDNDLTDMMFLTCATGYADYVLGERSLVSYLNQAVRRLDRKTKVFSQITDLVGALHEINL